MTDDTRMTGLVRTWLDEGVNVLPDRILADVLAELPVIRQRGAWRPWWRRPISAGGLRFAAAATAVLLVAVLAFVSYSNRPGLIGASPQPTPEPTPVYVAPSPGPLAAGTVVIDDPFPVRVQLTLGEGWSLSPDGIGSDAVVIYRGGRFSADGRGLIIAVPSQLFTDRCEAAAGTFDPGPSVADFADAFYQQVIGLASSLTDTTLDGYGGQHLQTLNHVSATDHSLGPVCGSGYPRWPATQNLPRSAAGETDEYWMLDVGGRRLVIDMYWFGQAPEADVEELRQIVESIQLEP
jgi:hypothetical protein